MNTLASDYELITFDVYMALMDIGGTLTPHIASEFGLSDEAAAQFVTLWRAKQMERAASSNAMALGHVLFEDCTNMALDYALGQFDLECDDERRERLVALWGLLNPWPEANELIAALNDAGVATAILSNGDQSMLEATTTRFTARFDHVLSAQTAAKYKPHPAVYELPQKQLGIKTSRVLHVAGSPNDVLGAIAFGMPCVWSNRKSEALVDKRYPPLQTYSNLSGVLDFLSGQGSTS